MKEIRRDIESFENIKKGLIKLKKSFSVIETRHTKIIKTDKQKIFFADDIKCFKELALINYVKKDVKNINIEHQPELSKINFYFYNKTKQKNKEIQNVYKLDLTSAYWQYAINEGVISDRTKKYFDENINNFANGGKKARLKALGSLATEKLVSIYIEGVQDKIDLVRNEMTRGIYIDICEKVDSVMKALTYRYRKYVIYYYWDCFFIKDSAPIEKIIKDLENFGFKSKFKKETVLINESKKNGFIYGYENKHHYPIHPNDLK